jgi:hypothetical protein
VRCGDNYCLQFKYDKCILIVHMNYELAKKLKDAGFPQPEEPTTGHYDSWVIKESYGKGFIEYEGEGIKYYRFMPGVIYHRGIVYCPTLSELIEACGENKFILEIENGDCVAKYYEDVELENWWVYGTGSTPEEAVAKLWLVINKK